MQLLSNVVFVMISLVCYLSVCSHAWSHHRFSSDSHSNRINDNIISSSTKGQQHQTTVASAPRRRTYLRTLYNESSVSTTEWAIVFPEDVTQVPFVAVKEFPDDPNRNIFNAPRAKCPLGSSMDDAGKCRKEV